MGRWGILAPNWILTQSVSCEMQTHCLDGWHRPVPKGRAKPRYSTGCPLKVDLHCHIQIWCLQCVNQLKLGCLELRSWVIGDEIGNQRCGQTLGHEIHKHVHLTQLSSWLDRSSSKDLKRQKPVSINGRINSLIWFQLVRVTYPLLLDQTPYA